MLLSSSAAVLSLSAWGGSADADDSDGNGFGIVGGDGRGGSNVGVHATGCGIEVSSQVVRRASPARNRSDKGVALLSPPC